MAIKTYKIRCKVTLQSYMEQKEVDLTPHIRRLTTQKDLYQPYGTFEIELLPGTDKNKASWYYRTSPMDYIEIRFTRDSSLKEIPIVMRGFVSEIGMNTSVDNEGRPVRTYTVAGHDLGKLFELTRIYYLVGVTKDLELMKLPGFAKLEEKYGLQLTDTPAGIIEALYDIAMAQLELVRETQKSVPDITFLASSTIKGAANKFALAQEDGSIWDMMNFFTNSPWNELFLIDLESAPHLVFRETPWKDFDTGSYIQDVDPAIEAKTLNPISIEANSIVQLGLSRSDTEVKNFFFTYPAQNMMRSESSFKTLTVGSAVSVEDLKTNPYMIPYVDRDAGAYRFGFRRFENTCEFFDLEQTETSAELAEELNLALQRAFKYNGAYESGSFTLKGESTLRPGVYMIFNSRPGVNPEYYVTGVNHELSFVAGAESFLTTASVQRGDGYLRTRNMLGNADKTIRTALK